MTPAFVRLADPACVMLWPEGLGRVLNPDGELVDISHPYWAGALADGSIVVAEPPAPEAPDAPPEPDSPPDPLRSPDHHEEM
jgi:hypothetical protein